MNKITFPLEPGSQGPEVADLQDGLQLLLDSGTFSLSDDEQQSFTEALRAERDERTYARATHNLVRLFQRQRRLAPSGAADEATVEVLNAVLAELGAFNQPEPDPEPEPPSAERPTARVFGVLRQADDSPLAGVLVRAYDKDLRSEEPLGEPVITDEAGRFEITYTAAQFRRG